MDTAHRQTMNARLNRKGKVSNGCTERLSICNARKESSNEMQKFRLTVEVEESKAKQWE